jgi:hypothetical protein
MRATNDLWKYNTLSNLWTWMKGGPGFEDAVYGTAGVAAASNRPGQRENAKTWTDASGNFWLFGGYGMLGNNSDLIILLPMNGPGYMAATAQAMASTTMLSMA